MRRHIASTLRDVPLYRVAAAFSQSTRTSYAQDKEGKSMDFHGLPFSDSGSRQFFGRDGIRLNRFHQSARRQMRWQTAQEQKCRFSCAPQLIVMETHAYIRHVYKQARRWELSHKI
jgi:hypothetical protein